MTALILHPGDKVYMQVPGYRTRPPSLSASCSVCSTNTVSRSSDTPAAPTSRSRSSPFARRWLGITWPQVVTVNLDQEAEQRGWARGYLAASKQSGRGAGMPPGLPSAVRKRRMITLDKVTLDGMVVGECRLAQLDLPSEEGRWRLILRGTAEWASAFTVVDSTLAFFSRGYREWFGRVICVSIEMDYPADLGVVELVGSGRILHIG